MMREKLLQNAQQFGTSLTQNYAAEEQNHIDTYSAMMKLGTQYLDQMTENHASEQQIQTWIENFFSKMPQVLEDNSVDLYAIVGGRIVAANPWDGDDSYDFRQTDWYRMAMDANGEVAFTAAYQDVITGKQVITIAQKARNSDNMLMFDVFPEDFHTADDMQSLPEGSSYYLCDQAGTLLYAHEAVAHEDEQLQPYVNGLVQRIQEGSLDPYDATITGPDGNPCGVYYYQMSNGWITILTIPFRTVLRELTGIYRLFLLLSSLFLIAAVLLSIRDYHLNRKMRRTDDTVRALGNLYYAIYRVNYKTGMYEVVKCANDTRQKISATGRYSDLLHTIQEVVTRSTYEEFASSFSLENIQQLVHDQVTEFGGDYLRRFENGERWVNVSILFDKAFAQDEVVLAFREINREKLVSSNSLNCCITHWNLPTAVKQIKTPFSATCRTICAHRSTLSSDYLNWRSTIWTTRVSCKRCWKKFCFPASSCSTSSTMFWKFPGWSKAISRSTITRSTCSNVSMTVWKSSAIKQKRKKRTSRLHAICATAWYWATLLASVKS